jgi:hypothetical protein
MADVDDDKAAVPDAAATAIIEVEDDIDNDG